MLTGPFREANSTEIPFEDDDPAAMRILLLIAHLKFSKVPQQLSFDTLVNLATLCDKYNTASLVKHCGKDLLGACQPSTSNDRLWIYWVFDYEAEFKDLCLGIWQKVSVDDDGEPLILGQRLLRDNVPSTFFGKLATHSKPTSLVVLTSCF